MKQLFCFLILLFCMSFSYEALAQEERATPKSGEGISGFLQRNGRTGKAYYQEFLELNKKQLRGKEELRLGVKYLLPPLKKGSGNTAASSNSSASNSSASNSSASNSSARSGNKTIREPLFGKSLAEVKVTGNRLKGACFYVVSGHGGPDPGAIGRIGSVELHEDEYAYDVALRLARNLMEEGAKVYIIIQDAKDGIRDDQYLNNSKRETCMGAPIPLNQVARLRQRCEKINALYQKDRKSYTYCRSIFLHVDSRSKSHQTDVFFYHAPKRLANSSPAGVFVELGNIQNTFDQRRFVMSSNRQALAKWMMEGFITDYKKSK